MKRLIEIIDQFQDKLLALNDQRNEIDEDMEQDDAVLAAYGHEDLQEPDKTGGPEGVEVK